MEEDDYDLELLMLYLQRSVDPEKLPGRETVVRFNFDDVSDFPIWWLVVTDKVDICVHDPGKEVDVYVNVDLKTMCQLWMGDVSYKRALAEEKLKLIGPNALIHSISEWIKPSIFAGVAPAAEIVVPA